MGKLVSAPSDGLAAQVRRGIVIVAPAVVPADAAASFTTAVSVAAATVDGPPDYAVPVPAGAPKTAVDINAEPAGLNVARCTTAVKPAAAAAAVVGVPGAIAAAKPNAKLEAGRNIPGRAGHH